MDDLRATIAKSLAAAAPIMAGYVVIGLPCGLMESAIGLPPWACFLISCTFYSGAGQFMIPNMLLAGAPVYSVIASVSFVNTRQMLYSTAFSPYFSAVTRPLALLFAATVTDESFGVNMERFTSGEPWRPVNALMVNLFSMLTWASANAVGCALGAVLDLPLAITSFAMTSIFICLLAMQKITRQTVVVIAVSVAGVVACKLVGLGGPAILLGAVAGVLVGMLVGDPGQDPADGRAGEETAIEVAASEPAAAARAAAEAIGGPEDGGAA